MSKVVFLHNSSLARKVDFRNEDWSSMEKAVKKNTYGKEFEKEYIKAYMKLLSK